MKTNSRRILTTHAGRLQRPDELTQQMLAHPGSRPNDEAFAARLKNAVEDAVRRQAASGVDVVSDGEMGKMRRSSYVTTRLAGCEERALKPQEGGGVGRTERDAFPQFFAEFIDRGDYYYKSPGVTLGNLRVVCTGPIVYTRGTAQLRAPRHPGGQDPSSRVLGWLARATHRRYAVQIRGRPYAAGSCPGILVRSWQRPS
jgi:5-methyltetrahydropteroyltriglutamate--homocysteine methyltransferase